MSDDNQLFIEFVCENILGKIYSQDPDGVNCWVEELAAGKSKGQVVAVLIEAVMDSKYVGMAAQDQFINRVAVSDYVAETIVLLLLPVMELICIDTGPAQADSEENFKNIFQ